MSAVTTKDVLISLENILADNLFRTSPKMSAFLRFVVEETLNGRSKNIKAFTIAIDALDKPVTFDPQEDPSVRVLAWRLRNNLEHYNANVPEQNVFIQLVPGSYVPKFYVKNEHDQTPIVEMT